MPWKKGQDWYWDQSQWNVPKGRKDNKNTKDGKTFLIGYDGRRIEVEGDGGSYGHGWSYGSQEAQLKEENQKLKETMRNMMAKDAMKEVPKEVIDLVQEDPRETLKAKQRELNLERKALNRLCKVKEEITRKDQKFQAWRESVNGGVRQEEKRHSGVMAELQAELKRLEKVNSGEADPETLEIESDEDELRQEASMLKKELKMIKSQFRDYTEYATQMETRNARMFEAMQIQMAQLLGAVQGSRLAGEIPVTSPKQEVKPPKTIGAEVKRESGTPSPERRGRSRTPSKRARLSMSKEGLQYSFEELQSEITQLPEVCQQRVLQVITEKPTEFVTWSSALQLIQDVKETMQGTKRDVDPVLVATAESTSCEPGDGLGAALPTLEHPCRPFRRFNGKDKMGPYATPGRLPKDTAKTPDGSVRASMDLMS